MDVSLFLIACCCPMLVIMLVFAMSISKHQASIRFGGIASADHKKSIHVKSMYDKLLLSWLKILTPRVIIAWISAFILISISEGELSLLSSFGVFIILLTIIPITIAFFAKLYFTLRDISPKSRVITSSLSHKEIKEGETTEIHIKIYSSIPLGYVLKVSASVPDKLGGDLHEVVTKSEHGVSELTLLVPKALRGEYLIGPFRLEYQDILGLSRIVMYDNSRIPLTILPQIPFIERYNLHLSTQSGADEDVNVQARINTEEYFSSRPYVRGDNQKHIHWKLTAKKDELMVRLPETTTVTYQKLSILILNVLPRIRINNGKNSIYARYRVAAELALDKQIRVAAAIIDFANRTGITVSLSYLNSTRSIMTITPEGEDVTSWLRKLASITLVNPIINYTEITGSFKKNNSMVITTSEIDPKQLEPLIEAIRNGSNSSEIMYCPLSNEIKDKLIKKKKVTLALRIIQKILLTKDYYSQTSVLEKLNSLFKGAKEKYYENDLMSVSNEEAKVINYIQASNVDVRVFQEDQYSESMDNIIQVLESE